MTTLFKAIQGYFSAEYHGRYLGLILKEICKLHPEILCDFIYKKLAISGLDQFTAPSFQTEFAYTRKDTVMYGVSRLADLAILDNGVPKILIEIKFHDHEIKAVEDQGSQFEDYMKWTKTTPGRNAIVISLNPLDTKGLCHAYWSEFTDHLKKYERKSELAILLGDYLQAERIALQDVNKTTLLDFVSQSAPNAANVLTGNREKFQLLPSCDEFDSFQNNLRILSMPCVKLIKNADQARQWQGIDHEVSSSSEARSLDILRVFSQHVLTGKPGFWCLRYGIELWEVNSGAMQCNLYSCVWDWAGTTDITEYSEISIDNLTDALRENSTNTIHALRDLVSKNVKDANAQLHVQLAEGELNITDICIALEKLNDHFN